MNKKLIKEHLGKNGLKRLVEFQKYYPDGWDFGRGKSLRLESITALEEFLMNTKSFFTQPSIFLLRDGYIELVWEDKYDNRIEVRL